MGSLPAQARPAQAPPGYPVGARFRPLALARSVPVPIWLVTALFGALLASWSVLVPQYHAPDEPNQVDAVLRLVQDAGWPQPGKAFVRPDGVGAIATSPYGSPAQPYDLDFAPIAAADATPRADRPAWDELGDIPQADGEPQPPGDIQQLVQHPPLYYAVGATVLRALPGDGDDLRWDVTIGVLRLTSALMVLWLPVIAWAGAHRLSGGNRIAATCAALVPLAVPELTHIGSSVNNDNLLALLAGLATLTIIYVLRGDTSLRTAAWCGLFIGLALFTKSLAIVLVPMAGLAYLLAWRRGAIRAPWRQSLLGGATLIAAGGWWWIVNIVRYRTFQPETPGFPLGDYLGDWGAYLDILVNGTIQRWWGAFGWFEVTLPTAFVRVASMVVIVLLALAVIRARDGRTRSDLLILLWPTFGLYGLMTLQSALAFSDHGHVTGISGRYLYGGMIGLAVGVGLGTLALGQRVSRVFPVLFFAAAAVAQWWSFKIALAHFWEPPGGDVADSWEAMTTWSPWSPSAAVTTIWVGVGLAVLVLASCVWTAVHTPAPHDGVGDGDGEPEHPGLPDGQDIPPDPPSRPRDVPTTAPKDDPAGLLDILIDPRDIQTGPRGAQSDSRDVPADGLDVPTVELDAPADALVDLRTIRPVPDDGLVDLTTDRPAPLTPAAPAAPGAVSTPEAGPVPPRPAPPTGADVAEHPESGNSAAGDPGGSESIPREAPNDGRTPAKRHRASPTPPESSRSEVRGESPSRASPVASH